MKEKIIIFITAIIWVLVFFIFKDNFWLYIDNSWIPNIKEWVGYFNFNFLSTIKQSTGFGYDYTMLGFSRLISHFNFILWDFFLYFLFFVVNFYFSYQVLRNLFSKKSSIYGGLIFSFNPVSLLFLNLSGFIFAYSSIVIILFSIINFIKTSRLKYILLLILGWLLLISYTRILWIYFVFLCFLWLFFYRNIHNFIKKDKFRIIISLLFIFVFFIPFFFSIVAGKIFWDSAYFAWVANYAKSFDGSFLYHSSLNTPIYENFQIKELTNNFASWFKNTYIYILFFTFFTVYWILINTVKINQNNRKIILFLISILLFCIFIKSWWLFLSKDIFLAITYKYFPFIANNTNWLFLIYIPILAFLFANIIENSKYSKITQYIVLFFVFLSTLPIFSHIIFWNNYKLETLSQSDFPIEYREEFFNKNDYKNGAVFYPASNLAFNWSPYPISVLNNNNYSSILWDNVRLVNQKQSLLAKKIKKLSFNYKNLTLFNTKNIFVFKNIYNPEVWYFDYYSLNNLVDKSNLVYSSILSWTGYSIQKNNDEFLKAWLWINSEYFLYSPQTIINSEIDTFFDEEIDMNSRPVIIDSESFHKPEKINSFEIPEENQNIRIDYKRSTRNPTKYFMKISDVDTRKDFLVQLNQTFGMSWKLKWIDADEYQRYSCMDHYEYFPITNNSFCYFEDWYLDSIWDYRYLWNLQVKEKNHFEGNFVGNTWLVESDDIRSEDATKSELYAVVIYEKQFWYMLTLWISFGTLGLLILATIAQEIYLYRRRKSEK